MGMAERRSLTVIVSADAATFALAKITMTAIPSKPKHGDHPCVPPALVPVALWPLSQNGSGWDIVGDRQSGLWMADVAAIIRRLYKYDVKNVHMCRTQFTPPMRREVENRFTRNAHKTRDWYDHGEKHNLNHLHGASICSRAEPGSSWGCIPLILCHRSTCQGWHPNLTSSEHASTYRKLKRLRATRAAKDKPGSILAPPNSSTATTNYTYTKR